MVNKKEETTMEWLKLLPTELQMIKPEELIDPGQDRESGDNFVGVMNDQLKRLYTLGRELHAKSTKAKADYELATTKEKSMQALQEGIRLSMRSDILRDILFYELNEAFNLWDKDTISVRTGFEVCWSENRNPFRGLFGGLGGQG